MELLTDLMERFVSIEDKVVSLVQTLEQQEAVEQALGAADKDLREAGTHMAQLADSIKATAETLNEILVEFRSAVQVIREADPARVAAAVAEAREFIARQQAEIQTAQQTLAAESAQRHTESQASLAAAEEAGARRHGELQAAQQTLAAESAQRHSEIQAAIMTSQEDNVSRHGETHAALSRQSADTSRGLSGLRGIALGITVAQAAGLALLAYMAFIQ